VVEAGVGVGVVQRGAVGAGRRTEEAAGAAAADAAVARAAQRRRRRAGALLVGERDGLVGHGCASRRCSACAAIVSSQSTVNGRTKEDLLGYPSK